MSAITTDHNATREQISLSTEDLAFCESLPTQRQRDLCSGRVLLDDVKPGAYLRLFRKLDAKASKRLPRFASNPSSARIPGITLDLPRMKTQTTRGPGSELKKLLATLGIDHSWCESCSQRRQQMDAWGVQGCREHLEQIVEWLKQAETKAATVAAQLKAKNEKREATPKDIERERHAMQRAATWNALKTCTWVNPLDPHRSLVLKAIEAAEGTGDNG